MCECFFTVDTHGTLIIVCAVVGFAVLCVLILCIILTVCRLYKRHYLDTQTHTSSTTPSPGTTTTVTTTSSNHESSFTNPIQYPTQQTGYSKEAEFMSEAPPASATFQSVEMVRSQCCVHVCYQWIQWNV